MIMLSASSSSKRRPRAAIGLPAARVAQCVQRRIVRGIYSRAKGRSACPSGATHRRQGCRLCARRARRDNDALIAKKSREREAGDSVNPWPISTPRFPATPAAPPQTSSVRSSSSAARRSSLAASWATAVADAARRSTRSTTSAIAVSCPSCLPRFVSKARGTRLLVV
jgi:hypothetical protein